MVANNRMELFEQSKITSATLTSTVANILGTTVLDDVLILKKKSQHLVSLKIIKAFNLTNETLQAFLAGIPLFRINLPHSLSTRFSKTYSIPPWTFAHPCIHACGNFLFPVIICSRLYISLLYPEVPN